LNGSKRRWLCRTPGETMDWMLSVVLVVALVGNTLLFWKLRTDDEFLRQYVKTSPKAFVWRKAFGEERAAEIIRDRLVPFGIAIWVTLLGGGLVLGALGY
jgi:hypothetical protein